MLPAKGFLSLGTRLALSTALVLTLISSLVFLGLSRRERDGLVASKMKAAQMVFQLASSALVAPLDFGDAKDVQTALDNLKSNREISFAAAWGTEGKEPQASLGQVRAAKELVAPTGAVSRTFPDRIELGRTLARPDGSALGAVLVVFSLDAENAEFRARSLGILGTTGACAIAIAVLLILVSRMQIIRPLDRLVYAAQKLARGDHGVRVAIVREDEIGRLGTAFNGMSAAIVDRETRLSVATARLREVLDHMRQAIVVFGDDGVVNELRSKAATKIFGTSAAGRHIRDLLFGSMTGSSADAEIFATWLELAFQIPESDWDEFAETGPLEATLAGESETRLELEWRPIISEGAVLRVMLIATDVTERKRLEDEVQSQKTRHENQLAAMRRIVAGSGPAFAEFLQSTDKRLAECHRLLQEEELSQPSLARVLELVHTIRGEARAYDLPDVADECAAVESALSPLRASAKGAKLSWHALQSDVLALVGRSGHAIDTARDLFIEASPIGRAILDVATVRQSDLDMLQILAKVQGGEIARIVRNLSARPFGECTTAIEAAAIRWAETDGKMLLLAIKGRDVRVPPELAHVLGGLLAHLMRNCIAHGLEPAEERVAKGKNPMGLIELVAEDEDTGCVVTVRDDGRGVDEAAVRARVKGTAEEHLSVEELLFLPGLTTSHMRGELSGLGVGLSAVRDELSAIGYEVRVEWTQGQGTIFTVRKQASTEALRATLLNEAR